MPDVTMQHNSQSEAAAGPPPDHVAQAELI